MKEFKILTASLFVLLLFTFSQCKKHKDDPQLPPETTTGAMTFGCKINGKVFVPKDGRGRPGLYAQYVDLGTGTGGGWYLNIQAIDQIPANSVGVNIVTDSLFLLEATEYQFGIGKGFAKVRYYEGTESYPKGANDTGSLFITKHDTNIRILSGKFSFTGTNSNGKKISVTEGSFDIRY